MTTGVTRVQIQKIQESDYDGVQMVGEDYTWPSPHRWSNACTYNSDW